MKKIRLFTVVAVALTLFLPLLASARSIDPIVSTAWLEENLFSPNLVILDVRKGDEFQNGHIPKAANVAYGAWAVKRKVLLNELPAPYDLPDLIGLAGINKDSRVVVVGKWGTPPEKVDSTRVAWTLKYMGIDNVAILDGGYDKWVKEKRPTSLEMMDTVGAPYKGEMKPKLFVKKADVAAKLGTALIVDVREAPFFKGEKKLDFVAKPGRIKGAVNLPSSLLYKDDGTYKGKDDLAAAATAVVGTDKAKEIILYCDTGKFATAWAYVLTDLLGYTNVAVYDGSSQEWLADPNAPVEP